jgi:hypothetical protein
MSAALQERFPSKARGHEQAGQRTGVTATKLRYAAFAVENSSVFSHAYALQRRYTVETGGRGPA